MKCPFISRGAGTAGSISGLRKRETERGRRIFLAIRTGLRVLRGSGSCQAGFTLIEVLVALTILSISMGVLLAVFLQGLDRSRESKYESAARVLAQSLLAQADTVANPSMGSSAGKSGELMWRMRVVPYGSDADRAAWQESAAQILATVSWRGDGGMRSITLSTVRLLPKAESDSDSQ
jgi:general secretion pathway protein I